LDPESLAEIDSLWGMSQDAEGKEINKPYRETITSTPKGARIGEQMGS